MDDYGMLDAIINRLTELLTIKQLTVSRLAYMSGMPESTIKNIIYRKTKSPGAKTIKLMCIGFGISVEEFYTSEEFRRVD